MKRKIRIILPVFVIAFVITAIAVAQSQNIWDLNLSLSTKSNSISISGLDVVRPSSPNISFDRLSENIELFYGTGKIECLRFSLDGEFLAIGTTVGVDLFTPESGQGRWRLVRRLITRGGVTDVDFANSNLITASSDGSITLWDLTAFQPKFLGAHEKSATCVAITPDSKYAVSGSSDKKVLFWNVATKTSETVIVHDSMVSSVDITSDGKIVASGGYDNKVRLYKDKKITDVMEHENWVQVVQFSPNDKFLASGGCDNKIKIYSLDNKRTTVNGIHNGWVNDLVFSKDSRYILSGAGDNIVFSWEHQVEEHSQKYVCTYYDSIEGIALSPNNKFVATAVSENIVEILEVSSKSFTSLNYFNGPIYSMGMDDKGALAVCGMEKGMAYLWDLSVGNLNKSINAHNGFIYQVAFSPNGKHFASCSSEGDIIVFNASGQEVKKMKEHGSAVYSLTFSSDGSLLASGSKGRVIVWDYDKDDIAQDISGLDGYILSLSFSLDGSLAVGTSSGNLYIVEPRATTAILIKNLGRSVNSISFHSEKKAVAFGTTSGEIGFVTVSDKNIVKFQNNDVKINAVIFSPDGNMVISGDDNGEVELWKVESNSKPYLINIHGGSICSLQITSNSQFVVSAGYDGVIRKINLTKKSGFVSPDQTQPVITVTEEIIPEVIPPTTMTRDRLAASVDLDFKVNSFPVVDEKYVYICKTNGGVFALNKADLSKGWSFETSTIFATSSKIESTPAIDNKNIYVSTNDGSLFALNKDKGNLVWSQRDIVTVVLNQAIIENGDFIYLAGTNKQLVKVKKSNGEKVWTFTAGSGLYTTPLFKNGAIYFGGDDSKIYAVKDNDGSLLWSKDTGGRIVSTQAAFYNGIVVIANSKGKISAYDAQTGESKWTPFTTADLHVRMIQIGQNCFMSNKNGEIVSINMMTGNLDWSQTITGAAYPQLATDGQKIYVTGSPKTLVVLNPSDGSIAWEYEAGVSSDLEAVTDSEAAYVVVRDTGKVVKLWKETEITMAGGQ